MTTCKISLNALLLITGMLFLGSAGAAAGHGHEPAALEPVMEHDHNVNQHAHDKGPDYDEKAALAKSQAAVGQTVGAYAFLDGSGQTITLESLRGKPVLISLIYTSCYHICPTLTTDLARIVKIARAAIGDDSFSVLTIGFDTRNDTPDRMRLFAKKRGLDSADWHFLSASVDTMERLAGDIGFSYFSTAKGFDHMIQATLLDGEGKVYRQIYGMAPEPPALVEPLKELLWGKQVAATPVAGWINNIKLFCTVYDPATGLYQFDYSPFISFGIGLFVLGGIAVFIVRAWRKSTPTGKAA